jgi:hypothetical protein
MLAVPAARGSASSATLRAFAPKAPPEHADLVLGTQSEPPDIAAQRILLKLEGLGLIKRAASTGESACCGPGLR